MATHKLLNYLRTHRRRAGLSQDEVAFLLGCESGSKVSRHEQFRRLPNFLTALAYEAVFRAPVRELFAGLFDRTRQKILRRAQTLADRLCASKSERRTNRKLETLAAIARAQGSFPIDDQ